MRALRCLVALALFFGLAAGASAGHHENALIEELTAIGDQVSKAMVENDVEHLLSLYAEDAISLPNYSPRMEGMEAFRQSHAQMSASGMKVISFESEPTDAWAIDDHVIEVGKFEIELSMGGMPIQDRGKYVTVYQRNADGELKIKVETWNTDRNPMEMMGGMMGGSDAASPPPASDNQGRPVDQSPSGE